MKNLIIVMFLILISQVVSAEVLPEIKISRNSEINNPSTDFDKIRSVLKESAPFFTHCYEKNIAPETEYLNKYTLTVVVSKDGVASLEKDIEKEQSKMELKKPAEYYDNQDCLRTVIKERRFPQQQDVLEFSVLIGY